MATAHDVADLIRQRKPSIRPLGLHKLLYYAQAWSMVWDGKPLFSEKIQAWENGPVVAAVWANENHQLGLTGSAHNLTHEQTRTVDAVLEFYAHLSDRDLVRLTHREKPWLDARGTLEPWEHSKELIDASAIRDYFEPLQGRAEGKRIPDQVRRGAWIALQLTPDAIARLGNISGRSDEFNRWLDGPEDAIWAA